MNNIDKFMKIYMFALEQYLCSKKLDIAKISFQSDEANIDKPLKAYLKRVIESNCRMLPSDLFMWNDNEPIYRYKICRVLLPEDITDNIRKKLERLPNSVFTNPDIILEIDADGMLYYETVELKTTKQDSIPGSSVQQVKPLEWVIFIKHSVDGIDIATGQYIHAINSKMQFPDRSPRPQVSFKELQIWNARNRIVTNTGVTYQTDANDAEKQALLTDWQGVLAQRWVDVVFDLNNIKMTEPWFNNTLRRFILHFLGTYDKMGFYERQKYKSFLDKIVKKQS